MTPRILVVDMDQVGERFEVLLTCGQVISDGISAVTWRTHNNAASVPAFVTTAAQANGTQINATKDVEVSYPVTTSTTATIGSASSANVVLEVCPTNSATASDWKQVSGPIGGSQNITLAVVLQSVQIINGTLRAFVPAGYYHRIRQTLTGTSSASANGTGQTTTY